MVAASSCQLLSLLAIAARARVHVLECDDHAKVVMPQEDKRMRLTKFTLRPRIVVGSGVKEERVLRLTETAHEQCYITDSQYRRCGRVNGGVAGERKRRLSLKGQRQTPLRYVWWA